MEKREKLTEEDVDILAKDSANALSGYFRDGSWDEDTFKHARLAATTFSACAKWKQTNGAREMMNFSMARELATDKKELQLLINKALPHSALAKK